MVGDNPPRDGGSGDGRPPPSVWYGVNCGKSVDADGVPVKSPVAGTAVLVFAGNTDGDVVFVGRGDEWRWDRFEGEE